MVIDVIHTGGDRQGSGVFRSYACLCDMSLIGRNRAVDAWLLAWLHSFRPTGIGSFPAGLAVQPNGKYPWAGEAKIVAVGYSENNSTGATRRGPRPLSRPIAVAGGWAEKRITAVNAMTRPSRICPSSSLSFVTA